VTPTTPLDLYHRRRQTQDFRAPPACPHRQWPQTAEASPAADGTTAPDYEMS